MKMMTTMAMAMMLMMPMMLMMLGSRGRESLFRTLKIDFGVDDDDDDDDDDFRQSAPQGPLLAKWATRSELSEDGHLCVRVPCVYQDPTFSATL